MTVFLKLKLLSVITAVFGVTLIGLFFAFVPSSVSAQSAASQPGYQIPVNDTFSSDSPNYNTKIFYNFVHTGYCLTIGQSPMGPCLEYKLIKNAQGVVKSVPILSNVNTNYGAIGSVESLIVNIYGQSPVKTSDFIASLGQGIGIVKEANAQVGGSGNSVLSPIFSLWEVSRNFAYLAMIIIFLIIGLMVMFRQRLNPQTVVTVQLALPGLVVGLVLITFSYFLASVITDTAFLGTNIVGYFFSTAQKNPGAPPLLDSVATKSVLDTFSPFLGIITIEQAGKIIGSIYQSLDVSSQRSISILAALISAQYIAPIGGAFPPPISLVTGPVSALLGGAIAYSDPVDVFKLVIPLLALVALIYQMLKLLLKLISCYLTIIFLTISSPFQFLIASLPGRTEIATGWMFNMLGNVLVFPAVLAVFYFVAIILGREFPGPTASLNPLEQNALIPAAYAQETSSIVGRFSFPLLGGIDLGFVPILLAFGTLMALPSIPDLVIKAVGKASQVGQVLGNEISGGIRSGQGYYNQGQGALSGNASYARKSFFGDKSYQLSADGKTWITHTTSPSIKGWMEGQSFGTHPAGRGGGGVGGQLP